MILYMNISFVKILNNKQKFEAPVSYLNIIKTNLALPLGKRFSSSVSYLLDSSLVPKSNIFGIYADKLNKITKKANFLDEKSLLPKHQPAAVREWIQSVYSYDKNELRNLKNLELIITKWIKIYFGSIPMFVRKKMYNLKKRLITNKVYISSPYFQHTSYRILITLYFFAEQGKYNINDYLQQNYNVKKTILRYFNVDYLLKNIDNKWMIDMWKAQLWLFKVKINSYWLAGILEKDKLQFFKASHDYLKIDWFKKSLVYYNDIVNSISKIIKIIMLRYKLKLKRLDIDKLELRNIISKWINVLINSYPKSNINNRIIFNYMIIKLINWLIKNNIKKNFELNEKNNHINIEIDNINKIPRKNNHDMNIEIINLLYKLLFKNGHDINIEYINNAYNRVLGYKINDNINIEMINIYKTQGQKSDNYITEIIKKIHKVLNYKNNDDNFKIIKDVYMRLYNKIHDGLLIETIKNIKKILAYKTEEIKKVLKIPIRISKFKFFLYVNTQISKASLPISFNYLTKYNTNKMYLGNLGLLNEVGRDRLYPNTWFGKSYMWDQLSNSGNILKILVLKHIKNIMNGWANNSCIVIIQNIYKNYQKMDNPGSKSDYKSVKEQRVNDNLSGSIIPLLRCTLMCFERNNQLKMPFKLNKFRYYNTVSFQQPENNELIAYFVTGFADAESSFVVRISKNSNYKTGWVITARFQIGLHKKDLALLELMKNYFKVGSIYRQTTESMEFRVSSTQDLINVIIPHFDKYPLITQKQADFILFKKIVYLMNRKEHLTIEGIQKIVNLKFSMNNGLSEELKAAFLGVVPIERPLVQNQIISDPYWLAGFTSGDGCFVVDIAKSPTTKIGIRIQLRFQLTQHSRDKLFMESLISYFGCGSYITRDNKDFGEFIVTKFSDITEKIIPFFDKYKIVGVKSQDFQDFKKIVELMKNKVHLSPEGIEIIYKIKAGMNTGRK